MNNFIKTAKRLGTSAILLLGTCLTAQAQSVVPKSTAPANPFTTCVPFDATSLGYTFVPANSGQVLTGWSIKGDLTLVSQSGNDVIVSAKPATGSRFGRGRISANYNTGTPGSCPQQTPPYDVNKTFTPTQFTGARSDILIVGPSGCISPGSKYAFSVEPVLSSATQIGQQIGVDTYSWAPFGAANSSPYFPLYSGDGSAVQITAPANPFTVSVTLGSCNTATGAHLSRAVGIIPNTPVITGVPTCLPTTSTGSASAFSLTTSTDIGATYTWSVTGSGWSSSTPGATTTGIVATGSSMTILVIPGPGAVDISVSAKAPGVACTAVSSLPVRINRQLAGPFNVLTAPAGCITANSLVTLSISNPPANTDFRWTLPLGWSFASGSSTNTSLVTVNAGTAGGTVKVSAIGTGPNSVGCPATPSAVGAPAVTGELFAPVTVSGPATCPAATYTIVRTGSFNRSFELQNANVGCIASGPGISYEWTAANNPSPPNNNVPDPFFSFPAAVPQPGNVTVRIRNTNTCLDVTVGVGQVVARQALSTQESMAPDVKVAAYPNPAGSELNVEIASHEGTVQLTLTDALGRTVQQRTTKDQRLTLNVSTLPTGVYVLRAVLPNGKSTGQFVQVQH